MLSDSIKINAFFEKLVMDSVDQFITNEFNILLDGIVKVKEECINHRLATILREQILMSNDEIGMWLSSEIKSEFLYVDCEYDLAIDQRKKLPDGNGIRPDIILHSRGRHDYNLLYMEIKKQYKVKSDIIKAQTVRLDPYNYKTSIIVDRLCARNNYRVFLNP
jgi:hypothetical protein